MGEVWKAQDLQLGRFVAIKYLRAIASDEDLARFRREAETSSRLNHPGVTRIYTVGQEQGRSYIVMQFVEGRTLAFWPHEDPRGRVRIVRDAALAVDHAHNQGVLHRDIKPSNILLEEPGPERKERNVVVTDFGLAKWLIDSSPLTKTGQAVGTPAYMPPEQVLGGQTGRRGDVYSLGATLYEVLTGRPPYTGDNALQILRKVVDEDPPQLEGDLGAVVAKAMERDPRHRYATAAEFAEDLDRWLDRQQVRAPRVGTLLRWRRRLVRRKPIVLAVGGGLFLAVAAWIGSAGRTAVPADPGTAKVNELLLAWVTGRAGREELALRTIRDLESAVQRQSRPETWLWLGRCRRLLGRDGAPCWDEALRIAPDFRDALLERARDRLIAAARLRGVDFGKSAEPVEGAAIQEPRDDFIQGLEALFLGRAEPAEAAFTSYLRSVAWDGLAYALRAQARRLERRYVEAEADAARADELSPKDPWVAFLGATVHHDQSRFSAAEREYTRAIALDPSWGPAYAARGALFAEERLVEKAEADLRGAVERNPRDLRSLLRLGELLLEQERWTEAEAVATRAVHLDAGGAAAYRARARLFCARKQLAAAEEDWTKAISADPSHAKSFEERGNVRRDTARYAEAIEDWRKAIELDPRLGPVLAPRIDASTKALAR
jgi:tetratricopeptide (TPR) repeat protein